MPWTELIGQAGAVEQLQAALNRNRLHHAYLFHGPAGVGKRTAARILTQAWHCRVKSAEGGCGQCRTCRLIGEELFPGLIMIGGGGSVRLEEVREMVARVLTAPLEPGGRVFVVRGADRMTAEAANRLLKVLEEPPPETVFILTATALEDVLPTIRSRCLQVAFARLTDRQVDALVGEHGWAVSEERAVTVALAGGSPGMAAAAADNGMQQIRADVGAWLKAWVEREAESPPLEMERDALELRLRMLAAYMRDIMVWKKTGQSEGIINQDQIPFIREQAAAWADPVACLMTIERANRWLAHNVHIGLLLEVLWIEISEHRGGKYADSSRGPL